MFALGLLCGVLVTIILLALLNCGDTEEKIVDMKLEALKQEAAYWKEQYQAMQKELARLISEVKFLKEELKWKKEGEQCGKEE